jgi:hypothetical protein
MHIKVRSMCKMYYIYNRRWVDLRLRTTHYALRTTHYALRTTHYALRNFIVGSRFVKPLLA